VAAACSELERKIKYERQRWQIIIIGSLQFNKVVKIIDFFGNIVGQFSTSNDVTHLINTLCVCDKVPIASSWK
jgi:hypothetical protein